MYVQLLEMAEIEQRAEKDPEAEKDSGIQVTADMESTISFLEKGSMLNKVNRSGRRNRRYFHLKRKSWMLAYSNPTKCWKRSDKDKIPIKDIVEILDHEKSSVSSQQENTQNKPSFTIVVGKRMKPLRLIAPDADTKNTWVNGLRFLVNERSVKDPVKQERIWLEECFEKSDKNHDGAVDKDEIASMLKSLNVSSEVTSYVKSMASKQKLTLDEFIALYKQFTVRKESAELFSKYASNNASMNTDELSEFFRQEQSQDLTENELEDIITRSEQCPQLKRKNLLSQVGFNIMFSLPELNVKQMKCRTIYQDMTQPMNHYFINSSHNTYLEGHQLRGKSSPEQYCRVLTHRCRCVELDVWDGKDDEPIIYHGYTFTTKIRFKDALKAIKMCAFKKSKYPVIVSIENHCSLEQQVRMAKHLKDVFEDKLLLEPLPEDSTVLPSPEQLKGRVIVKAKKLPLPRDMVSSELSLHDDDSDEAAEVEDEEVQKQVKESKTKKEKVALELSDLVVMCQAMSFKSFMESKSKGAFVNMSSFGESKALKLVKEDGGRQFIQHNAFQLSRIYPAGSRTDSSNYDPIPMWNAGCQV